MSLIRKGVVATAGRGGAAALQMASGILVSRWLGPSGVGQFQFVNQVGILAGTIGGLGIGQASIYFINHQRVPAAEVVAALRGMLLGWCPALAALLGAGIYFNGREGGDLFGALGIAGAAWVGMTSALLVAAQLLKPVLLAELRVGAYAASDVLPTAAQLLVTVGLVLADRLTVSSALLGPLASAAAMLAVTAWLLRSHVVQRVRPRPGLMGELIGYGVKLAAGTIAYNAHLSAPVLMLGWLTVSPQGGFTPVGLFTRATSICGMIALVGVAATPLLYARWADELDASERRRQVELATRLYALLGFSVAIVLALSATWVIEKLYGGAFVAAAPLLRMLAFGTVMQTIANAVQSLFPATGRAMMGTWLFIATLVVNVALNAVAIPRWGEWGAAAAMTTASAAYLAGVTLLAARVAGIELRNCFVPRWGDVRRLLLAARR